MLSSCVCQKLVRVCSHPALAKNPCVGWSSLCTTRFCSYDARIAAHSPSQSTLVDTGRWPPAVVDNWSTCYIRNRSPTPFCRATPALQQSFVLVVSATDGCCLLLGLQKMSLWRSKRNRHSRWRPTRQKALLQQWDVPEGKTNRDGMRKVSRIKYKQFNLLFLVSKA